MMVHASPSLFRSRRFPREGVSKGGGEFSAHLNRPTNNNKRKSHHGPAPAPATLHWWKRNGAYGVAVSRDAGYLLHIAARATVVIWNQDMLRGGLLTSTKPLDLSGLHHHIGARQTTGTGDAQRNWILDPIASDRSHALTRREAFPARAMA